MTPLCTCRPLTLKAYIMVFWHLMDVLRAFWNAVPRLWSLIWLKQNFFSFLGCFSSTKTMKLIAQLLITCAHAQSLSHVRLFAIPWTAATRLLCPWDLPGENTEMGCHFLFQGIFQIQRLNQCLLSPALVGRFFTSEPPRKPNNTI